MKKDRFFYECDFYYLMKTFRIMRIMIILTLATILQTFANDVYSQKTKLSLELSSTRLTDILDKIEQETEFHFLYNENLIDTDREVSLSVDNQNINVVLDKLFAGTDVEYTITDRKIILAPSYLSQNEQDQKNVSGKVIDKTGRPLPGLTVVVKGSLNGTITDMEGEYTISNVPDDAVLVFTFVGMRSQEIEVSGMTTINVTMEDETIGLEEVVAIGYGTIKKSVTTGAIASVSNEDIANTSVTRTEQALQGKTSGVQVISTSGAPGADMKVRIRGYSSNGNSDPLYIVDGVKTSSISFLDPNDIATMEVLKDAASASIYGAEGGNGVILISTKRGKSGKGVINYEYQYSVQSVGNLLEVLNAQEYANYYNEAGVFNITDSDLKYDTDWLDKVFETAPTSKHYISFTKGTEGSNILLSLSSLDNEGILAGDKDSYKRYTVRMNAETKILPWLKVGNNASFSLTKKKAVNEDNEVKSVLGGALRMDPLTPVYYQGGMMPDHVQILLDEGRKLVANEEGNYYGISKYLSKEPINPFVRLTTTNNESKSSLLQGSLFAEFTPVNDIVFTSRLGYEVFTSNTTSWSPEFFYNGTQSGDTYNEISDISEMFNLGYHWLWENYANYSKTINEVHNINALLGMSAESYESKRTGASGGPMTVEGWNYAELDFIFSQSNSTVSGATYLNRKTSYFGRLAYDFKNKYLFMASFRVDGAGSSYLPKDKRWGVFPSVSAGWVFTEESFFPESIINYGKLRASWGQNGSLSNLSNYSYASNITTEGLLYQTPDGEYQVAAVPNRLDNPELTWETSVQTDIGLDLRMFDSRLEFTFDYFHKKTVDLLTPNTPPAVAGNTAPSVNGGDVLNEGVEFSLNYRNSIGEFNYGIRGNLSFLNNEVTYLDPTISRIEGFHHQLRVLNTFEQGYPVWYFRGYKTDGINPETGEVILMDISEDGIINDDDKTMIGNPIPKYTFGAGFELSYKGFDVSANAQGQAGNDVFLSLVRNDMPGGNYPKFTYENRWTQNNTTGATMPKAGAMDSNVLQSDLFIEKGDFIRIKQIQLGYTLPKTLVSKLNMSSLRMYVSLDDYFTITKYRGMEPEAGSNEIQTMGTDRGMYPVTRKALFGLSITF